MSSAPNTLEYGRERSRRTRFFSGLTAFAVWSHIPVWIWLYTGPLFRIVQVFKDFKLNLPPVTVNVLSACFYLSKPAIGLPAFGLVLAAPVLVALYSSRGQPDEILYRRRERVFVAILLVVSMVSTALMSHSLADPMYTLVAGMTGGPKK